MISKFSVMVVLLFSVVPVLAAETGTLQAGASKEDITPAPDAALPMSGFAGRKDRRRRVQSNQLRNHRKIGGHAC